MNSEHRITNRSSGNLGKGDAPELWQSIIDQIPNDAFFKGMRILNICAGTGTEAVILVNRLKSLGWSTEEILESLWLIDNAKKFTGELKLKGFRHVVPADALTWKPEDDMKFDLVIGNPPYQAAVNNRNSGNQGSGHNIWPEFVKVGLNHLNPKNKQALLAFVTPEQWRRPEVEGKRDKMASLRDAMQGFSARYVMVGVDQVYFSIGQSIKIDAYILGRGTQETVELFDAVSGVHATWPSSLTIPRSLKSDVHLSALKKILTADLPKIKLSMCSSTYKVTADTKVGSYVKTKEHKFRATTAAEIINAKKAKGKNGIWLNKKQPFHDDLKVIVSFNFAHGCVVDNGQLSLTDGTGAIFCSSIEEAQGLSDFLMSPVANLVYSSYHKIGSMQIPVFWVTLLPHVTEVDQDKIQKLFGFTQAELDCIYEG